MLLFLNLGTSELVVIALMVLFMFYSLFHAATNMQIPGLYRLIWGVLILVIPLLGGIAYWVMGRKGVIDKR